MTFEEAVNKSGSMGLNRSTMYGTAAPFGLTFCLRFATSNASSSSADAGACIAMVWFLLASLLLCHRTPAMNNRSKTPPPIPAPVATHELALLLPLLLIGFVVGAAVGFATITTVGAATAAAG